MPVLVLAYDCREIQNFIARNPTTEIDRIFLWQGNARILISMVNYIEDKRNVLHDTREMSVPVLLMVEDDITYCSLFLPVIYTEMITQSRRLLSDALNLAHKLLRMRARPKILLCSNYEEAERAGDELSRIPAGSNLRRAVSPRRRLMPDAGFELARMIRSIVPDVPIVLQSSHTGQWRAPSRGLFVFAEALTYLDGGLAAHLDRTDVALASFVFRQPDGQTEVARAADLNALETLLHTVPEESFGLSCRA